MNKDFPNPFLTEQEQARQKLAEKIDNPITPEQALQELTEKINYQTTIGFFRKRLRISAEGVYWGRKHYPLEAIDRIGWGGTRESINFIPLGTAYSVCFGTQAQTSRLTTRSTKKYQQVIIQLWFAVGVRLMLTFLEALRAGQAFKLGSAVIMDERITLIQHNYFSKNKPIEYTWGQVQISAGKGFFYITAIDDKNAYVRIPYREANNAHVWEYIIDAAFKKGITRLSDTSLSDLLIS